LLIQTNESPFLLTTENFDLIQNLCQIIKRVMSQTLTFRYSILPNPDMLVDLDL